MELLATYSRMICYSDTGEESLKEISEDLLSRVREGDDEAFIRMFEEYNLFIFRFIYNMVGNRELAEELAQESFMGAYRSRHLLRGDARLSTWLCGIAKNIVGKSFRSRRHEHLQTEIDKELLSRLKENSPLPDKTLLDEELENIIRKALLKLDEDRRLVFILKIFQQLSYEEIAEITGFSISKLKTDLRRGKADIRRLIRPYMEVKDEL